MTTTEAPLLELTTTRPDPVFVAINGQRYRLLHLQDLRLGDHIRVERDAPRLAALAGRYAELSAEESTALSTGLDDICRRVLQAPVAVHAALTDAHRLQVLVTFMRWITAERTPAATAKTKTAAKAPRKAKRG